MKINDLRPSMQVFPFMKRIKIKRLNYDDDFGKLIFILDIVDAQKVLIDDLKNFLRVIYVLDKLQFPHLRLQIFFGAKISTFKKAINGINPD